MLCTNCNKKEAQVHFQSTVNGMTKEAHLCSECAAEIGYPSLFSGFPSFPGSSLGLDGMLSHLFGADAPEKASSTAADACPLCKTTAEDIGRTGRVGCAQCYNIFSPLLTPYIRRIHGNTFHSGHVPKSAGAEILRRKKLDELSAKLQQAIRVEDFETAARLRDEIREFKKEV